MGLWEDITGGISGFTNTLTLPFRTALNTATSAWNDYTGKTATELSANAAKGNTAQQIQWERERAKNAHQWEVEDLTKAGLNPILSAGGSGAVTGGISPQMPDYSNYKGFGAIIPLVTDLINMKATMSNARKADSESKLNKAKETTESTTQTLNKMLSGHTSQKIAAQEIENKILENKKYMSDIDSNWYEIEKYIDNIGKPLLKTAEDIFKFKMFKDILKKGYKKSEVFNPKTGEIKPKWYKHKNGKWKKLDGEWKDLF